MITMNNIRELGLTKGAGHTWRAQVTHCVHGHEYTPENTIIREDGVSRTCRACKNARKRRYWHAVEKHKQRERQR